MFRRYSPWYASVPAALTAGLPAMKLDRDEIICGQPAKKVRDFLGGVRAGAFPTTIA
jgi:hypothetical protein